MKKKIKRKLISTLLLSTLSIPAHALTSANLTGPNYLFNSDAGRPRIYHGFDVAYMTKNNKDKSSTTTTSDQTPLGAPGSNGNGSDGGRLKHIADMGYTHIQISPPCLIVPSTQGTNQPPTWTAHNFWWYAYQPYVCVLDSNYQKELDDVFGKIGPNSNKTISNYGIPVTASDGKSVTVGFRIGNDRYGTLADLVTLIQNAKKYNLGVIADVSFHQIGWQSPTFTGQNLMNNKTEFPFYAVKYGSIDVQPSGQIAESSLDTTVLLNAKTFVSPATPPTGANTKTSGQLTDFIIPFKKDDSYINAWNFGPPLDPSSSGVQMMIAGYMQQLYDIGISGVRMDDLTDIVKEARITGLGTILKNFPLFKFSYGEVYNIKISDLGKYGPVVPLEDFPLQSMLGKGLGNPRSVSKLLSPVAIGNCPSVTFSVTHDMYDGIGGGDSGLYNYSKYGIQTNKLNGLPNPNLSQLAISYLCAKRDGSPMVLRFEDELDADKNGYKTLVMRALAFRTLMEQMHAPHEYIVALNDSVLLIARQYGFVVINTGDSYPIEKMQADINSLNQKKTLSYYLPNGTYRELSGLTPVPSQDLASKPEVASPTPILNQSSQDGIYTETTYPLSWSGNDSLSLTFTESEDVPIADLLNAKFFILQTTDGQSSCDVTFTCPFSDTQRTAIVGNHPLLGDWKIRPDLLNLMMQVNPTSTADPHTWSSLPIGFPSGLSIQYKNAQATSNGITKWERIGAISSTNRTFVIPIVTGDTTTTADGIIVATKAASSTSAPTAQITPTSVQWP